MRSVTPSVAMLGFTLLELVIVLALFSLLMLWSYQSLDTGIQVQSRVSESIAVQEELRNTHQALREAISSGGRITGDDHNLTVHQSKAYNIYKPSNISLIFSIDSDGELLHYEDGAAERLMQINHAIAFRYLSASGELITPSELFDVGAVEFVWSAQAPAKLPEQALTRWVFSTP